MNVENNGQQNRDGNQNDGNQNKDASSIVDDDVNLTAYALGEITDPEETNRLKKLLESDSSKRKEFETTIQLASLIRDSVENDLPMAPGSIHDVVLAELDGSPPPAGSSVDQAIAQASAPPAKPIAQKPNTQKTHDSSWWKNNKRTIASVSSIAAMILVIVGVLQFQEWSRDVDNTAMHAPKSSSSEQAVSEKSGEGAEAESGGLNSDFFEDKESSVRADSNKLSMGDASGGDSMKFDGKLQKKTLSIAGNEAPQSQINLKNIENDDQGGSRFGSANFADSSKGRNQSDSSAVRKYHKKIAQKESAQKQSSPGKPDPARAAPSPESKKFLYKNDTVARGGSSGGRKSGGQDSASRNSIKSRPEPTSKSKDGQLQSMSGPGGGANSAGANSGGAAGGGNIAGGRMNSDDAKKGLGGFGGRGAKGGNFGSGAAPGSGGGSGAGRAGGGIGGKSTPSKNARSKNAPSSQAPNRSRSGISNPGGFGGSGFGGGGFGGGGGSTPNNQSNQASPSDPSQRIKRMAQSKGSIDKKSIPSVRNEFDRQNPIEKSIRGGGLGQDAKSEYKQQSQSFSNNPKPKKSAGAKLPSGNNAMPNDTKNRLTENNFKSKSQKNISGKGGEKGEGKGTRESLTPRYQTESSKSKRDSDSSDKLANTDKTESFSEEKKKAKVKKVEDAKADTRKADEKSESPADDAADQDEAANRKNAPAKKDGEKQDSGMEAGDSPQSDDANADFNKKDLIELEKVRRIDPSLENDFVQPIGSDALSSFAIDTDTASYTYVRDMLRNNRLPRPEDVRIEEMINYFDFKYAQPKENERFSVQMELASSPWSPGNKILKVGLQAKNMDNQSRPPSNLVFLVDVSGSMHDRKKLPLLKTGLKKLVKQLREDDYVSIVTYANHTLTRLKPTDGSQKDKINAVIDSLEASGGTKASEGLKIAYGLAKEYFRKGGTNRIIMGTDGDFNMGITDTNELTQFIKTEAQSGVYLTICGFGVSNFKDQKMQTAAQNSNGKVYFIDNEDEAERVFVERISGLVTIAKDVKVQLVFNPRTVQSYRLIGYENRILTAQEFEDHRTDAGEMDAGDSVTALYEIVPGDGKFTFPTTVKASQDDDLKYQRIQPEKYELTRSAATDDIAALRVHYKDPNAKLNDKSIEREFVIKNNGTNFNRASQEFQLATAVTGLGLMLRGSQHRGTLSFEGLKEFGQSVLAEREFSNKQRKNDGKVDQENDAVKDSARSVLSRRRMEQRKEVIDLIDKAAELYKRQR